MLCFSWREPIQVQYIKFWGVGCYFSWSYNSFNFSCSTNYYKNRLKMFRETGARLHALHILIMNHLLDVLYNAHSYWGAIEHDNWIDMHLFLLTWSKVILIAIQIAIWIVTWIVIQMMHPFTMDIHCSI